MFEKKNSQETFSSKITREQVKNKKTPRESSISALLAGKRGELLVNGLVEGQIGRLAIALRSYRLVLTFYLLIVLRSRLALSQTESLKIDRSTFLKYIDFADIPVFRL